MSHNRYREMELRPLAEAIDMECYNTIGKLCAVAEKQVQKLTEITIREVVSQYLLHCTALIGDAKKYMLYRRDVLLPYIRHNWPEGDEEYSATSTPNEELLGDFRIAQDHIKNLFSRMQLVTLPLYSDTIYPEAYRVLRNHMALIENNLAELIFFEDRYLLPRLQLAQLAK